MRRPRRFDDALMEPPDAGSSVVDAALLASLRAWCEGGAFPALMEPLRVATIAPHAGLDAVACALDGSHDLARLGRWRGLAWRLQILLRESVAGRGAPADMPWDCGWWRDGTLNPAKAFRPRRPTLLMVRETAPASVVELLSTLRASSVDYSKPVRVVIVSETAVTGTAQL